MGNYRRNDHNEIGNLFRGYALNDQTLNLIGGFVDYLKFLGSDASYRSSMIVVFGIFGESFDGSAKEQIVIAVAGWLRRSADYYDLRDDGDSRISSKIHQAWQILLALHLMNMQPNELGELEGIRFRDHSRLIHESNIVITGLKAIGSITNYFIDSKLQPLVTLQEENKALKAINNSLKEQVHWLDTKFRQAQATHDASLTERSELLALTAKLTNEIGEVRAQISSMDQRRVEPMPDFKDFVQQMSGQISDQITDHLKSAVDTNQEMRQALGQVIDVQKIPQTLTSKLRSIDPMTGMVISPAWHLPEIRRHTWNTKSSPRSETFLPVVIEDWHSAVEKLRPKAWNELRCAVEESSLSITGQKRIPTLVILGSGLVDSQVIEDTLLHDKFSTVDVVLIKLQKNIRGLPVAVYTESDLSILPLGNIPARECRSLFKLSSRGNDVALSHIIEDRSLDYRLQSPNVYRRLRNLIEAGLVEKTDESNYQAIVPTNGYPGERYSESVKKHETQSDRVVDISFDRNSVGSEWFTRLISRVISIIYKGEYENDYGDLVPVSHRDRLLISMPFAGLGPSYQILIAGLLFEHHRVEFTFVD